MKRAIAGVALALVAGVSLFGISMTSASATETEPAVCPTFVLHSITGTKWEDSPEGSKVLGSDSVKLTKPVGGGTEFATEDVGINLSGTTAISVEYKLSEPASFAGGAVRLFYYSGAKADTLVATPTKYEYAIAKEGTLVLADVTGYVGTLGVVYDASNDASGSVTFSNLKIGDIPVKFTDDACKVVEPSPSQTPPGGGGGSSPSPSSSGTPETLPVTGSDTDGSNPAVVLSLIAAIALTLGVAGLLGARRRRIRTITP